MMVPGTEPLFETEVFKKQKKDERERERERGDGTKKVMIATSFSCFLSSPTTFVVTD